MEYLQTQCETQTLAQENKQKDDKMDDYFKPPETPQPPQPELQLPPPATGGEDEVMKKMAKVNETLGEIEDEQKADQQWEATKETQPETLYVKTRSKSYTQHLLMNSVSKWTTVLCASYTATKTSTIS